MSLAAGTVIGKYVVRRKLAEGGMAEIYLCRAHGAEGFEKDVVIKRVRVFLANEPTFVQMFIAEARVASRLNHPNLVQIFDFDKHEDRFYLAMEYVHGHSLWDVRQRAKERMLPIPPTLVATIGANIARGLHYAHRVSHKGEQLGLVHRDVTPQNVLLSYDGAIKLTDFGIAKKAGVALTSPGVLKGKFAYMSPEQARGEEVDARTDVFALGVVLWELLTGGRLFDGESEMAVLRAVQQSVIASPARLNPDVPPELDAAVMKALNREPSARFQTAQELERALAQVMMAKRPEEVDVGLYLAQLYEHELGRSEPSETPQPAGTGSGSAPLEHTAPRQPTAVLPRAGATPPASGTSEDEDVNADTHVIARKPEEPAPVVAPSPSLQPAPLATPSVRVELATPAANAGMPSLGMYRSVGIRRALAIGAGLFVLIAGLAFAVAFNVASKRPPPSPVQAPAAMERAVPAPAPAPEAAPPAQADAPSEVVAAGPADGSLLVRVKPWATIYIDGASKGEVTSGRRFRLPPGVHEVRAVHLASKRRETVVIEPGQETVIDYDMLTP